MLKGHRAVRLFCAVGFGSKRLHPMRRRSPRMVGGVHRAHFKYQAEP